MDFTATGAKGAKDENELSKLILDAAFLVHRRSGLVCWRTHMKPAWLTNCGVLD